ncbi:MAG: M23 family metallopeptidase [Clostridia bacterium]|nr:M23 family metallopeptidase [Clostridia bacterium]
MLKLNPRTLGIYAALILLVFSVGVPLIGRELRENNGADREQNPGRNFLTDRELNISDYPYDTLLNEAESGGQAPAPGPAPDAATASEPVPQPTAPEVTEAGSVLPAEAGISADPVPDSAASVDIAPDEGDLISAILANLDISQVVWPLEGEIIRAVGLNYSETFADYRFHSGFDIAAAAGAEAAAVFPGKIVSVSTSKAEKVSLVIDHGGGWLSTYAHLAEARVSPGEKVTAGQILGTIGEPGLAELAEGPHLHYALSKDGQAVNPLEYLP